MKNLASSLLLLLLINKASATIVDSGRESAESIALSICEASSTCRISRVSTIGRLHDYFGSTSNIELSLCRELYMKPVKELKEVIETSSHDVCSKVKVETIDKFHWKYIVGAINRKWKNEAHDKLPEPFKLFFIHYANGIAEQCKQTMHDRLSRAAGNRHVKPDNMFLNKLGKAVDELSFTVISQTKVKNYDTFILVWNQISDKERRKGRTVSRRIDALSEEPIIAHMKTKDPRDAWTIQHRCRHELRPVYQQTVLPVMRLLELGYGGVDDKSKKEIEANELIRNWYATTQICELLIPINFYQDESMKPGETSVLSDQEQAHGLVRPNDVVSVKSITPSVDIRDVHLDDVLQSAADDQIVKQIKTNIKTRSRVFSQIFKNLLATIKSKFGSKLKNFSLFRKKTKDDNYIREDGVEFVKESEPELEEFLEDDENPDTIIRAKRGLNPFRRKRKHLTAEEELNMARKMHKMSAGNVVFFICVATVFLFILGLLIMGG